MAKILIENLDPNALKKLESLAQSHGRSLQEEVRYILETAAESQTLPEPQTANLVEQEAISMQQQLEQHAQLNLPQSSNSTFQSLNLSVASERLNILKQTISTLSDLTIRQAIEEGRRF